MNNVIVDGVTYTQDQIVSPKFHCNGCITPAEYVSRIVEYGIKTVVNNGDGSFTYTMRSPHCICEVEFTNECP